jgi:hypothetical protein
VRRLPLTRRRILGVTDDRMGARDPDRNRELHGFFPGEHTGGSVAPAGQITLDSGLNPAMEKG